MHVHVPDSVYILCELVYNIYNAFGLGLARQKNLCFGTYGPEIFLTCQFSELAVLDIGSDPARS